ncbi:hypothetical protein E0500_042110 [Streptomyces sp. KM273126]|uniref:hypothetical protein n=1 Tax=Streptomyces sp. KM273126 TaxID=2545247 RepID=UPI0014046299|nr:hypothetical protein [Streptomyces sp. KM273126]MBA2813736.1 hypothetical protein [Streptomyces sp. KM273126]
MPTPSDEAAEPEPELVRVRVRHVRPVDGVDYDQVVWAYRHPASTASGPEGRP